MKLFDEKEKYTEEAMHLDSLVNQALRPIIYEYIGYGYSIREIIHIIAMAALTLECEYLLEYDIAEWKTKKAKEIEAACSCPKPDQIQQGDRWDCQKHGSCGGDGEEEIS